MQNSDIWILRAVGFTLCVCAVGLVGTVAAAQFSDFEIDPVLDRLTFLLLGGLLTAFSTKFTGKDPVEVETAPGDVVVTEPIDNRGE